MKVDVVSRIVIQRPRGMVASFAVNPDNAPRWYANIKKVEWKTPPPARVGSRISFAARFLGRTLRYTYEIVEIVPEEYFIMRTAEGPFPMETTYSWDDAGGNATKMTLRNRGTPKGFFGAIAPILALAMRRANRKDLARLKQVLEHGHWQ